MPIQLTARIGAQTNNSLEPLGYAKGRQSLGITVHFVYRAD